MVAPGAPPEAGRDLRAMGKLAERLDGAPGFPHFLELLPAIGLALGDGNVGFVIPAHDWVSARSRSSRTKSSSSASLISVRDFSAPSLRIASATSSCHDEGVNGSSRVPATTKLVDEDVALLPDAEGAVGGLVLHGGIPPSVEMDHMRGGGEVQTRAARLQREHEEGRAVFALETIDHFCRRFTAVPRGGETAPAEDTGEMALERIGEFAELGENERLFPARGDFLAEFGETQEFRAVGGIVGARLGELVGVVARSA